jgi:hypothetical protein
MGLRHTLPADFEKILELLKSDKDVKGINFEWCPFVLDASTFFVELRKHRLNYLAVEHMTITPQENRAVVGLLSSLHTLKLDTCLIGDEGMRDIAIGWKGSAVEDLRLPMNNITECGISMFADALKKHPTMLKRLNLSGNRIMDTGVIALASAMHSMQLTNLNLTRCNIGFPGIVALRDAIVSSQSMCVLALSNNALREDPAFVGLASMIRNVSCLQSLRVDATMMGNDALLAFANSIRKNLNFRHLHLGNNPELRDLVLEEFMRIVGHHPNLRDVSTPFSGISIACAHRLRKRLHKFQCKRTYALTSLLSVHVVPRLGTHSKIRMLPVDLIRLLGTMLQV